MKISVVIPALNAEKHIEAALNSIWMQDYPDVEIIVMDGGSEDRTTSILESNKSRISYWESKEDGGTSKAMNDGFARATGELVTFLCSDDRFKDSKVFSDVVEHYKKVPSADVICTEIEGFDAEDPNYYYLSKSDLRTLSQKMTVNLPGAFFRKSILADRQFSSQVEVANDYELFVFLKESKKANIELLDRRSVIFSMGGRTNSPTTDFWMAKDCLHLRLKYYGLWPAIPLYLRDLAIGCLRKLHFRPMRWMRFLKKVMGGSRIEKSGLI